MKTLRLLATLLLVALSMGLYSCSKDDFVDTPPIPVTPDNIFNDTDKKFAEYMDDYSDIKCRYAQAGEGIMQLSGIKNKHLWFSEFDTTTKKLKSTWLDIEETDTIQQVYSGYGEYKEMKITFAIFGYYKKTKAGDIVGFSLDDIPQIIFTSNGKTKRTPLEIDSENKTFYDWYNESVLIGNRCYSSEGDPLFTIEDSYFFRDGNVTPISYEEGIKFDYSYPPISFERFNIKEGKSAWKTNLTDIELPSDSKISYTILDKSANVWEYKVDAVLYNGMKHSYIFTVNMEDGKANVAEEGVKVTSIALNKSQVTLDIGEIFQLVDTVKPNNAENSKVVWTSSNESVATVDQNGLVTAKSYGESVITVTTEDGGFTATSNIIVKKKEISDYITSKTFTSMINVGGYIQGIIGCEIINNSKEDILLTNYTVIDDNENVLLTNPYDNNILKAGSSYREDVSIRGVFNELTLRWTYIHNCKKYTYTTKYKVTTSL